MAYIGKERENTPKHKTNVNSNYIMVGQFLRGIRPSDVSPAETQICATTGAALLQRKKKLKTLIDGAPPLRKYPDIAGTSSRVFTPFSDGSSSFTSHLSGV